MISLGSLVNGLDFSAGGSVTSTFSRVIANEFRFGVDFTRREYDGTSLLGTGIVDGGLGFGTDPTLPGKFRTSALRARNTLHFTLPHHWIKVGAAAMLSFYDQTYAHALGGDFVFGGPGELAATRGAFSQAIGGTPIADFNTQQYSGFLQDLWTAAPGLEITLGLRYDYERLDRDEVPLNQGWLALSAGSKSGQLPM